MQQPLYEVAYISDIRDMLDRSILSFPNNTAFTFKKDNNIIKITYTQLGNKINALGNALTNLGLKGKKIMLCGENCCNWCISYLSVVCGVGVIVPVDKELTSEEIDNILKVSGAQAVIADNRALNKISRQKGVIFINMEETSQTDKNTLILDKLIEDGEALRSRGSDRYLSAEIDPEALGVLLFTSGTTGMAKGVMLSQRNICSDLMSAASIIRICSTDVELSLLPLHHAYEGLVFLEVIYAGGCIAFCGGLRHLAESLGIFKPTFICAVPLIIEKLHAKITAGENVPKALLSLGKKAVSVSGKAGFNIEKKVFSKIHEFFGGRLRFIITGAAAVDPVVAHDFKIFGIPIIVGYGLTECSPIAICNSDREPHTDSVGRPIPGVEAKLSSVNEDGIGEICIKGPIVMMGYYNDKDSTASVMRDGWFHTGDLGSCDENGFYKITGRLKNIIVTKGGKNIYPEELEYYLCSCDTIAEAVVYSSEDGDKIRIAAEIYPDIEAIKKAVGSEPTRRQILAAVSQSVKGINRKLPNYKNISTFSVRDAEFPKTTTKKIKRTQWEQRRND